MAAILGKRKRQTLETIKNGRKCRSEDLEMDAQELFKRHFEAKFKPLPVVKKVRKVVEDVEDISKDDLEEESDWGGISNDGEGAVEVIEHTDYQTRMALVSKKEELKAFMVWRFPKIDLLY
jgi:hypothetical protein